MKNFNIINSLRLKNTLTKRVLTKRNGKYVVIIEKTKIKMVLEKTNEGYILKKRLINYKTIY